MHGYTKDLSCPHWGVGVLGASQQALTKRAIIQCAVMGIRYLTCAGKYER